MNKKLIGVIIGVSALVVLIIVLAVTFTIRNVVIDTTSTLSLTSEQQQELISDSGIKMKSSIFSVDESIVVRNIELAHPSYKVISVERKFPNTVCVNLTNRTPVYSMNIYDGTHALVDRELKIVDIVESDENVNYITRISGYELKNTVQKGGFLNINFLREITAEAEKLSFVNQRMSSFIPSIEYSNVDNNVNNILLKTNTGVILVIKEVQGSMGTYFNYAYTKYYTELTEHQKTTGYVYLTDENIWTWSNTLD
ncbi:MAG: FtsQ-type POTRA domain-containing protein [Clostridiales bacterium]|nr:FtsQ-type POTRA domain-containing protein [Clostridiales bacterium]